MPLSSRLPLPPLLLGLGTLLTLPATAGTYRWAADSGLLPDQVDSRMALVDTSPGHDPLLAGGALTLSTAAHGEMLMYLQAGSDIAMPDQLVVEAGMRLGAGSTTNPGPGSPRAHAVIVFNVADSIGNALFIGTDRLFLLAAGDTLGNSIAIDTDDRFHDYRIEVSGTGIGAAVSVFQDGAFVLGGSTFGGTPLNAVQRISFGDGTIAAQGSSQWQYFSHNASASVVPEPASALLAMAGLGLLALQRRRTH